MKKKVSTLCKINEKGEIKAVKREVFQQKLQQSFVGEDCILTVEKLYEGKTDNQREYYFAVVVKCCIEGIFDMWGEVYNKGDAHEFLNSNLLYDSLINESTGEVIRKPKSIRDCDIVEMAEYIDRCIAFIFENFNIHVPPANKDWRMDENKLKY